MMAPASANPKSQDKKHASRASSTSKVDESPDVNGTEPAFVKELQKSHRNAVKKLNATAKIDTILAENQGKSLDNLVEEKKINADQKAQALKKPVLQSQISQLEEQIANYKEVASQYEERLASERAALEKDHLAELDAVRANAVADATESSTKALREQLLSVTRFLCAAANIRHAGETESPQGCAFEAVLYQVYSGNQSAVNSLLKLIEGAQEKVSDADGKTLEFTYGDVKQICSQFVPDDVPQTATETVPASDPTVANAGLTELGDTSVSAVSAGQDNSGQTTQLAPPSQTLVSDAANPVAETSYDANVTTDTLAEVPRDPAETDTGLEATPANVDADVKTDEAGAKGASGGRGRGGRGRGRGDGRGRGRGDRRGRGRRGGRGRGGHESPATPAE